MEKNSRSELLQGTLDLLILRTLVISPLHGHAIAKHIQRTSDEILQVETGSLYPALKRLEDKGWIAAQWQMSKAHNRELRIYKLTPAGRKQLIAEESRWKQVVRAIGRVLRSEEV